MWFLVYAYTITQSCIKRAMFERGIYEKAGPQVEKVHWQGAVRGIEGARAWTGAGAGVEKTNALPRAFDRGGVGNWGRGPAVFGVPEARNEHYAGSPMFSWFIFGLFDLISAPPLSLSQIGYAIVLLCWVCFARSLYLGFRVWNGHVALVKAELCFFLCSRRIPGFWCVRTYW